VSGSPQGAGGVGGLLGLVVWGEGPDLSRVATSWHLAVADGNGNVTALVDAATGTVTGRYEYGAFGEPLRASGPAAGLNPFRFSTKYQDDETGFLYYGYRYYNALTGRWLSRDPIQESGGINMYAFVQNEPISKFDLLGEADKNIPPSVIIGTPGAGIGAVKYDPNKPFNWHHPITYYKSVIDFSSHPLVKRACIDLKYEQKLVALQNHSGPHSARYHEEVETRLSAKWATMDSRSRQSQEICRAAVEEVVDSIVTDIKRGKLQPNDGKLVAPVPDNVAMQKPDKYGYVKRMQAMKRVQQVTGRAMLYLNVFEWIKTAAFFMEHRNVSVDVYGNVKDLDTGITYDGSTGELVDMTAPPYGI